MDHNNVNNGCKVNDGGVNTMYRPYQAGHLPAMRSSEPQTSKICGACHGHCRTLGLLLRACRPEIGLMWGVEQRNGREVTMFIGYG